MCLTDATGRHFSIVCLNPSLRAQKDITLRFLIFNF